MATKTHVKKDNKGREEEWSWDETPELLEALAALRKLELRNQASA